MPDTRCVLVHVHGGRVNHLAPEHRRHRTLCGLGAIGEVVGRPGTTRRLCVDCDTVADWACSCGRTDSHPPTVDCEAVRVVPEPPVASYMWDRATDASVPTGVVVIDGQPFPLVEYGDLE